MAKTTKYVLLLLFALTFSKLVIGQCPVLLDETGAPVTNPQFLLCSKDPRTLFLSFNRNFGAYTINWGDGTPVTSGGGYITGNVISHNYAAGVSNYTLTITIPGPPNCVLTASVVKEEPTTASIQVPFGGVTRACAPATLQFVNSSTNNSSNTIYVWDFGDGSPNETYNSSNLNQTIPHLYQRGTVDCGTKVTLTAYNFCNIRQGSVSIAEYSPILIWDLDKPAISSDTLFCYPDTVVTFSNTTDLNCIKPGEGNVEPRTEYWRFIDYFGPGLDSIIDWRPFGPPRTIRYPGIGTYRVELRERSFCGEVNTFRTIRIIPAPIAGIIANKDTICIGENIIYTNTSTGPANIFRWNPGDGSGWRPFTGGTQTLSYSQAGNYLIRIAVNVNGGSQSCKDTAFVPVVVVPDPIANFIIADTVGCDSLITAITNTSVNSINWNWTFGQGQSSGLRNPPNQRYGSPGRYIVTLAVGSDQGCGNSHKDTVYVFASPKVNITANNVCVGNDVGLVNTTVGDPNDPVTGWSWDFGGLQTSAQRNPSYAFPVAGNFNIVLNASTPFCSGTDNYPIVIYSLPIATPGSNKTSGCTPLNVLFGNTSSGAISYVWDFGDGATSTLQAPSHIFVNTGSVNQVYSVRLIARSANGCLDTSYLPITVFPAANADFSFTAENKCVSLLVNFTNISSGATSYQWYFGDGDSSTAVNPTHNYVNSGTFVTDYYAFLMATSAQGCTDTISKNVSVNPEARFGFTASPDSGCSPLSVNFTAKTGAVSYNWEFPDGTAASGVFVQKVFFNNGTSELKFKVQLTATNANGCLDVTQQDIVVFPNPQAALQVNPSQGCAPLNANLINNSLGGQSYEWDYGDGNFSFVPSGSHQYLYLNSTAGPLTYKVILKAVSQFGCEDTAQTFIRVFPIVNADFDTLVTGCGPLNKTYTAFGGASYFWNFGNGDISNTTSYTTTFTNTNALADQQYQVRLIATSSFGCTDTVIGRAVVFPTPIANFNSDKLQGCSPLLVNLANTSTGGQVNNWNYGDGNLALQNAANHAYSFSNTSSTTRNYSIQLISQNAQGCKDTIAKSVSVFPEVISRFVHDTIGCDPFPVKFFNNSQGAVSYNWELDSYGSSVVQEPSQVFNNTTVVIKSYNIRLVSVSPDNCVDTAYSRVQVYPKPLAAMSLDKDKGCQPLEVTIQNTSAGATNYQWTYGLGGGSTNSNPLQTKVYPNGSDSVVSYTISLVAFNQFSCSDTTSKIVLVYPKVKADFDSIPPGCSPYEVFVQDRSVGEAFIAWNFNNEGFSFNSSERHTFTNNGSSDQLNFIQLVAENSFQCKDTLTRNFLVYARPKADFNVSPLLQRFPLATVNIGNTTVGNWNYSWNLGDGTQTNAVNPGNKTYSTWGVYSIKLLAQSQNCEDTITKSIEILPPLPVALYNGGGEGCKPFTAVFTNTSQYGNTYLWDFGDGGNSTSVNPTYTFYNAGTYKVSLQVTGFGGEVDVIEKVAVVTVRDNAEAYFTYTPENAATNTDPVDFLNLSKRADYYYWDFGDGSRSEETNPTHFYQFEGVFDVRLIADNIYNCPDTFFVQNAVKTIDGGNIELPTAFTPSLGGSNGGKYDPQSISNDVFFPFNKEVEAFKMEIFSRWGEKIFESTDINIGWDGYFNGKLCQQDVYVYMVSAVFKGGKKFDKVGDVTLLR